MATYGGSAAERARPAGRYARRLRRSGHKSVPARTRKARLVEGRNIHIDELYAPAGAQVQALAKDLVTLQPDVIFAQSRPRVRDRGDV